MGVLGWSADQALDTPMPYVHAALEARSDYDGRTLRDQQRAMAVIFGVTLEEPEPAPATPEDEEDRRTARLRAGLKALVKLAKHNEKRRAENR